MIAAVDTRIAIIALLALSASSARAEPGLEFLDPWAISGSNTLRIEHYDTDGNTAASPYAFDGDQVYNEFNVRFSRRQSPWDLWRGEVNGVLNSSDYRSPDAGIVPERLSLVREKGDSAMPYRVEFGDYFGYFSYRSLQRSLKGAQIELQPRTGGGPWRHSIQFLAGANSPGWRRIEFNDDFSFGGSWMADHRQMGTVGLNVVRNYRDANPTLGTLRRSQTVWTAVGRTERDIGGWPMVFEGEIGHLEGDTDGTAGPASGQNQEGNGFFGQVSGKTNSPFTYRFRYERYDQHYQPAGSVITSDRRSAEGHLGYRLDSGVQLRGRVQSYRDGLESANPQDTTTRGFILSGPVLRDHVEGLTAYLDAYTQDVEDMAGGVNRDTKTMDLNLNKTLANGWNARMGLLFLSIDDNTGGGAGSDTRQISFAVDAPVSMHGFRGTVSPGIVLRDISGGANDGEEFFPTLALGAARGPHSLGFNLGYDVQDRDITGAVDTDTLSLAFNYQYTGRKDLLGLEINNVDRNADPGADTDAWRVSVFWTHYFDKPATRLASAQPIGAAPQVPAPGGTLSLTDLQPGMGLAEAQSRLQTANVSGGVPVTAGTTVYDAAVLPTIDQRQRVVVVTDADALERSALIIDFDDVGNTDTARQTFERVRRALVDRYGAPTSFFEQGDFSATLAGDVNSGRFIRVMEWEYASGVLRFGIPRRLDRRVRMELQFAKRFPAPQNTLWSIEAVR